MPFSDVANDSTRMDSYFEEQYRWDKGNHHPLWAVSLGIQVGFVTYEVQMKSQFARINDLYVSTNHRRKGYGAEIVRLVLCHFDELGVEQIDLNVRRDNPHALEFWQAQGFGIASFRLRMYRDPKSKTAYTGALSSDMLMSGEAAG